MIKIYSGYSNQNYINFNVSTFFRTPFFFILIAAVLKNYLKSSDLSKEIMIK